MPAEVVTASVFRFERNLFFYYELKAEELHPEALFKGLESCLEECPFEEAKRFYITFHLREFTFQAVQPARQILKKRQAEH
jgi:hypothetical protein